jgi:uncharacterized protein YgiM (DUF1202 family)
MVFLAAMMVMLIFMRANKPPVEQINHEVVETLKRTEREVMFNINPGPIEEEYDYTIVIPEEEVFDLGPDIIPLDLIMYATSAVNVRAGAGTDYDRIGSLAAAQEVKVVGRNSEVNWYMIEFRDDYGFVSGSFLSEDDGRSPDITDTPE